MLATNTICGDILAFSLITPHTPPTIACGTKVLPLSLLNFNHLQTQIYCVRYCASSSVKLCTLISCSTFIFGTYNSNITAFSILGFSISSLSGMLEMQNLGAVRKKYTKRVPKMNVIYMLQKLGQKKTKGNGACRSHRTHNFGDRPET